MLSKKWICAGLAAGLASSVLTSFLGGCISPSSGAPPVADAAPLGGSAVGVPATAPTVAGGGVAVDVEVDAPAGVSFGESADAPVTISLDGHTELVSPLEAGDAAKPSAFNPENPVGGEYYYYLLGQMLLRERNWQDAERALTKVTETDVKSTETRMLVAHLATQRGDLLKAIRYAQESVNQEPKDVKARQLLAGLLTATKSFEKAVEQHEEVLKIDHENVQSRLQLAQLYGWLKNVDQARKVLAPLLKKPILAWKAYLALGRAHVNSGNLKESVAQFRKAYELDHNRLEPVLALGAALQEVGLPKDAESVYRGYLANHPNSQEIHTRLGRLLLNQDNQDAALTEFQAISQLSPDSVPARLTSALILLSQKRYEDSLKELRLAEAVRPDDGRVHYYLGQVLEFLDRFGEAEAAYSKVVESEAFYAEAQLRLAFLEAEGGHRKEGIRRVRKLLDAEQANLKSAPAGKGSKNAVTFIVALNMLLMQEEQYLDVVDMASQGLEIDPNHGRLRFNRAIALDKLGRWPEAEKDLLSYVKQNPNDASALNYLGYTWAERKENLPRALDLLQQAIVLAPGDGFITDSLGWVLFRMNRLEESLERMREAVRLEPKDATIRAHLGDVLFAMGRVEEARTTWQKALDLDPSQTSVRNKLQSGEPVPSP